MERTGGDRRASSEALSKTSRSRASGDARLSPPRSDVWKSPGTRGSRGVTLTELMIATAIFSVAVLGFIASFRYITISLHLSRGRTLANNLAQEKIEVLKNLSYYQLLLSTSTSGDNNFSPPIPYDNTNYPPQTISIGGITFKRYALVAMANLDPLTNAVSTTSVVFPDTGLKQIKVNVVWFENGAWRNLAITNLSENPNVNPLDSSFTGSVKWSSGALSGILPGAWVRAEQNQNWGTYADAGGNYAFRVYHGTYTIRVSSQGYYDSVSAQFVANRGIDTPVPTIYLTQIATATIGGYVWLSSGLVISQVVASTLNVQGSNGFDLEYVTLFNPTTHTISIADCGAAAPPCVSVSGNPPVQLNIDSKQNSATQPCPNVALRYISTFVPSGYYYTIVNSTSNAPFTLGAPGGGYKTIVPDARYRNVAAPCSNGLVPNGWNLSASPPVKHILHASDSCSVLISDNQGNMLDAVGWNRGNSAPPNNFPGYNAKWLDCLPDNNSCLPFSVGNALSAGNQIVRVSSPNANVGYGADLENYGQAYNSLNNQNDFMYTVNSGSFNNDGIPLNNSGANSPHLPESTTSWLTQSPIHSSMTVITGIPALGAWIGASDPYSGSTQALRVYIPSVTVNGTLQLPVASFNLVGVTTTSAANPWSLEITTVTPGNTYWKPVYPIPSPSDPGSLLGQNDWYGVPHSTFPGVFPPQGVPVGKKYYSVVLDSSPPYGFVEGIVTDISNNPVNLQMTIGGASAASGANGYYFHSASTGIITIVVNSNNLAPWLQQIATVGVLVGQITTQNFIVLQGGSVSGYITSGTTPLPNIVVTALVGGSQQGTGTSDTTGKFYIANISSGTYTIKPVLDPGVSATALCQAGTAFGDSCTNVVVSTYTVPVGTFTVTGALASISGTVSYNSQSLTSGALILASQGSIASTPPAIYASTSPALANPIYAVSSQADGTYALPVRQGSGYNMSVYVPVITGAGVSITTKTYSGISVGVSGTTYNITVP